MTDFVHLHVHSEYSLTDSILRIPAMVEACREAGMPAIALTDQSNFFGAIKFYKAARKLGVKPILGADFYLAGEHDRRWPFTLLAMDASGYRNMIQLISLARTEGQGTSGPLVQPEWLERHSAATICLSGGVQGELGYYLVQGRQPELADRYAYWSELFADRFYLEVQRTGKRGEDEHVRAAAQFASETGCPLVATNDVCFLQADEYEAHEARVCIQDGVTLADSRRVRRYSEQQYLRSPAEMQELFADLPEALENALQIARRCNLELELGKHHLPVYPVPAGVTEDEKFRQLAQEGLAARLQAITPAVSEAQAQRYRERLELEMGIIVQMGFASYFLIVMDFIKWAKTEGIPVGPGRGSGAGSLVAYVLFITDLDPLPQDLLFERFLNPERISMPDLDIDFCMEGRDRVINYVAEQYGQEAVAQIVTFDRMGPKAVVRDVARVQGKSYSLGDRIAKLIPFAVDMTLEIALQQEEPLRQLLEEDADAKEIWEMAVRLEGLVRNCSKHAGGVVIAPTRITDFAPLYADERSERLVAQYDKNDIETVGLVKFDFLGLRTLTIIRLSIDLVNQKRAAQGESPLDIEKIDMADAKTFALLQRAETGAVFQLESQGMRDLIKRLVPNCFDDIVALVALFRPGPLGSGMVEDFIDRKHGRKPVTYPHEELHSVLESTYGIIVYQEQVMQIAQIIGNFTLGGADSLRRAMSKKIPEAMARQRQLFIEGAVARGVEENLARNLFGLMEEFGKYGFNKSHSAAYALVAYQTAWLKTHYPAEFMAAVMSVDMRNTDNLMAFVDECHALKIDVRPPDINAGERVFTVDEQGGIRYGLGAIKGLGQTAIGLVIDERDKNGAYRDLFDFCARIDLHRVNKQLLEALVLSGALDSIGPSYEDRGAGRAHLLALVPAAVRAAEQQNHNSAAGMSDMFGTLPGDAEAQEEKPNTPEVDYIPWSNLELMRREKQAIGLYLTGHPLDDHAEQIYRLSGNRISQIKAARRKQSIGGLVLDVRRIKTKKGKKMAVAQLDDGSGRIEVTLFTEMFERYRKHLGKDSMVLVRGLVEHDEHIGSLHMRAEEVRSFFDVRKERLRRLRVQIDGEQTVEDLARMRTVLEEYRQNDGCPLRIDYRLNGYRSAFHLGDDWRVEPSDDLVHQMKQIFGKQSVSFDF